LSLSLPSLADHDSFRIWRSDTSRWLPAGLDIARSHGLAGEAPHVFATGANLVVALDARMILKIFPPMLRNQFVSERGAIAG
jgi:hygromycin-B 7''-O-kinase